MRKSPMTFVMCHRAFSYDAVLRMLLRGGQNGCKSSVAGEFYGVYGC